MPSEELTVEQMCRDLLDAAIADGVVVPSENVYRRPPQQLSTGDITGMSNLLNQFLDRQRPQRDGFDD